MRVFEGGQVCASASRSMLPDGRLASASDDRTIRLWDVTAGAETARLEGQGPTSRIIREMGRKKGAGAARPNTEATPRRDPGNWAARVLCSVATKRESGHDISISD